MTAPVTDVPASIPSQADATKVWLAKQAEPVTPPAPLETPTDVTGVVPVKEGEAAPVETPAEPTAEPVKAGEEPGKTGEEPSKEPESRFRKADGTFAKVIKGEFNGEAFEFPEDALVPVKRFGEIKMVPVSEMMESGMLRRDYDAKREEEAAVVRNEKTLRVQAEAEAKVYGDLVKRLIADPNEVVRIADDPAFAKLFADSNELAIERAKREAGQRVSSDVAVQTTKATTEATIRSLAAEFQGVDPAVVQEQYARWLVSEGEKIPEGTMLTEAQVQFYYSPDRIREFYQREHQRVQGSQKPLLDKLAAMEAEIAELKGKKAAAAEKKNDVTAQALKRASAPPVLGSSGNSGGAVPAAKEGPVTGPGGAPLSLTAASEAFRNRFRE